MKKQFPSPLFFAFAKNNSLTLVQNLAKNRWNSRIVCGSGVVPNGGSKPRAFAKQKRRARRKARTTAATRSVQPRRAAPWCRRHPRPTPCPAANDKLHTNRRGQSISRGEVKKRPPQSKKPIYPHNGMKKTHNRQAKAMRLCAFSFCAKNFERGRGGGLF